MFKSLGSMTFVITVAWILVLTESFLFFFVIRPAAPNIHESVFSAVLKICSVAALVVIWVAALFGLEHFLFRGRES